MMVAEDAIGVMPPYLFLLHMLVPSIFAWMATTMWIQRCWVRSRGSGKEDTTAFVSYDCVILDVHPATETVEKSDTLTVTATASPQKNKLGLLEINTSTSSTQITTIAAQSGRQAAYAALMKSSPHRLSLASPGRNFVGSPLRANRSFSDGDIKLYSASIVDDTDSSSFSFIKRIAHIVSAPFPYAMCFLLFAMIALIFVDVISIAALVCITAVAMVVVTVLGNHWQGRAIWAEDEMLIPSMSREEKIKNTNDFFENLFSSIDYSLLIIFIGLFVVLENIASTGIPKFVWTKIVGNSPFNTAPSVIGICVFVLLASQFIGNVPVIQLAKPNVQGLDDDEKRYAWAILSFVASLGGNLTIMGSAANIIVAEKANRLDSSNGIHFLNHFQVCFLVTLLCCIIGAFMITCTCLFQERLIS
jgi:hypothetical protein